MFMLLCILINITKSVFVVYCTLQGKLKNGWHSISINASAGLLATFVKFIYTFYAKS